MRDGLSRPDRPSAASESAVRWLNRSGNGGSGLTFEVTGGLFCPIESAYFTSDFVTSPRPISAGMRSQMVVVTATCAH